MATNSFIQLKNISKTYDDGYLACNNINLSIDKGRFVTILGPSGCGKTTLLKLLAGFEKPTTGRIVVNGIDIKDLPINLRPTTTVFQNYALFPNMTVYQNIIYGLKVMRTNLDNVPIRVCKELEKVKKEAVQKANKKIVELKKDLASLTKTIERTKNFYFKNLELAKIQDMRFSAFQTQIFHYEKLLAKRNHEFMGFKLTQRNKRKIFWNKLKSLFGIHQYIKFDLRRTTKIERQIYNLIKLYLYKQPIDRKIDSLIAKHRDIDEWISYWENYPNMVVDGFTKIHTTRLLTKSEIDAKAQEVIELVGLEGFEDKYPNEISGGMQQRTALARAIVIKPEILLLDEPLSALDAKVRKKMQEELKRIHNELKITFILVTHDQEEALLLSDQVVVMSKGKIEQVGSAKNIYEHPSNDWVANFVGQANFFECEYLCNEKIKIGNKIFHYPIINSQLVTKLSNNTNFKLLIRPEDIEICDDLTQAFLLVKVISVLYKGTIYEIKCRTKNKTIITIYAYQTKRINDIIGIKWDFNRATPIIKKRSYR